MIIFIKMKHKDASVRFAISNFSINDLFSLTVKVTFFYIENIA